MKKASLFIIGLLLAGVSFAQEGFFKVYVDNEMSFHPSAAVEAADGGFITAVYDDNGKGELVKMSADGAIVNRVAIDLAAHPSFNIATIDKIYRDHTGRYEYYDRGRLYYSDFDWEVRSGHQLEISFRDRGGRTYERYYYDWDARRNLMLSETSNFSRYTAYRLY